MNSKFVAWYFIDGAALLNAGLKRLIVYDSVNCTK